MSSTDDEGAEEEGRFVENILRCKSPKQIAIFAIFAIFAWIRSIANIGESARTDAP